MNVQSMYVCPECVPSEPYSCGGPHLNSRKKQRRYEFFDAIRVVPAEPTDEMVERARDAAWAKTRELCQGPHTSMCLGDSDAITFAVIEAIAFSTSRVPTEEDR